MAKPFLSVILPVTGDSKNLPLVLVDLDRNLSRVEYSSEIVVSNVNTNADISDIAKKIGKTIKGLKLVENEAGGSLSGAIRQAMLLSGGNIKMLALSGQSVPADQLNSMIPHFKGGADLVIGARKFDNQNALFPLQNIFQKAGGIIARLILKDKTIRDPFSDFVAFKEEAAEKIFQDFNPKYKFINFGILLAAKKKSCLIKEASVYVS